MAHRDSRGSGYAAAVTSVPARRRGPRNDVDTRSLIVDVAERMFGDATIDAVSLRAVAREAGLDNRAVTYHFATKRDLVAAIVHRRSRPFAVATAGGLAALAEQTEAPSVRDVVEAVLRPFVVLLRDDPPGALRWIKVFTQLALTEDELFVAELGTEPGIAALFVSAAARALPELGDENVQRRAGIAMYSMITSLAGADRAAYGRPLTETGLDPDWLEELIVFTTAGLRG
jgi:AcrR family transcriptional regulator